MFSFRPFSSQAFNELALAGKGATNVTLTQAAWNWTGNAVGVNQRTDLTLVQQAWHWTGNALAIDAKQIVRLTQAVWHWTGVPFSFVSHAKGSNTVFGVVRGVVRGVIFGLKG